VRHLLDQHRGEPDVSRTADRGLPPGQRHLRGDALAHPGRGHPTGRLVGSLRRSEVGGDPRLCRRGRRLGPLQRADHIDPCGVIHGTGSGVQCRGELLGPPDDRGRVESTGGAHLGRPGIACRHIIEHVFDSSPRH
jgi:hypothetical protein